MTREQVDESTAKLQSEGRYKVGLFDNEGNREVLEIARGGERYSFRGFLDRVGVVRISYTCQEPSEAVAFLNLRNYCQKRQIPVTETINLKTADSFRKIANGLKEILEGANIK